MLLAGLELPAGETRDPPPARSIWTFCLATILQYWEGLTDQQMATAARTRLDLKYALHLPLEFPGFESHSLCLFRQCLLLDSSLKQNFQNLVDILTAFVAAEGRYSAESNLILSTICMRTQFQAIREATSNAIEAVAASYPEWLRSIALPHWYKRYGTNMPASGELSSSMSIHAMFASVGADGQHLLDAVEGSGLPALAELCEIRLLSQKWNSQFKQNHSHLELDSVNCAFCNVS